MASSVPTKNIPLYFHYMTIEQSQSSMPYDAQATVNDLCLVFDWLKQNGKADLLNIKHELIGKKKVMWLHDYTRQNTSKDTRIDIVFKSAKYDHVREVIDTEKMQRKGRMKKERDGDEEITHLALRLGANKDIFVAVYEYNHYGVTISDVTEYINESIERYLVENNICSSLKIKFEPYLSKEFLEELKNMKKRNVMSVVVDKEMLSGNEWMGVAGRNDIKQTVTVVFGKKGRGQNVPDDLITSIYGNMSTNEKIKRIRVEGSTLAGQMKIDTESLQMKHSLQVELTTDTREVSTYDCFKKIQEYLESMGGT